MKKMAVCVLTFLMAQNIWSTQKSVVLQNGLNGYTGCSDSYISTDPVPDVDDPKVINNSDSVELYVKNCPT